MLTRPFVIFLMLKPTWMHSTLVEGLQRVQSAALRLWRLSLAGSARGCL